MHYSRSSLHLCTMLQLYWGGIGCLPEFFLAFLKEINCVFPQDYCSRMTLQQWFLQLLLVLHTISINFAFSKFNFIVIQELQMISMMQCRMKNTDADKHVQ